MRIYQLALEQAKRAERACQVELVDDTASFISPSNHRIGTIAGRTYWRENGCTAT
jgi:hypothetical protein